MCLLELNDGRWRAAEHLASFVYSHPERFQNKTVLELGAGLGLVSILLSKMNIARALVATDGDNDTVDLMCKNATINECPFKRLDSASETGLSLVEQSPAGKSTTMMVAKLWWGEHMEEFKEMTRRIDGCEGGFQVITAADVIYEDDQVEPLIITVKSLLCGE